MQDKAELRKELLSKRDQIPLEVRMAKNRMIQERLLSLAEFKNAGSILFFASFRTEFDTTELIKTSLSAGKRVVLPKVDTDRQQLLLYEIHDFGELAPGYMGIPDPSLQEKQMNINEVEY